MSQITKKALAESLKRFMGTKPLSKITVNDIAGDSGVNRRTVYYHFQSIYALLEWIYKTEIAAVMAENKTFGTWQQGFLAIFSYLSHNRSMVLNTYHSLERDQVETRLYEAVYTLVYDVIHENEAKLAVPGLDKDFVVNFYKVALVGVLLEWIRHDMREDPHRIIENLDKIISGRSHLELIKGASFDGER